MPEKRCVANGNAWRCQKEAELRTATETITCAAQFSGGEPHIWRLGARLPHSFMLHQRRAVFFVRS